MTGDDCVVFEGRRHDYQHVAAMQLADSGVHVDPWAWLSPTCDQGMCINADHLRVREPLRISYPSFVCIYCGRPAGTKDHLLPRGWSGESARRHVAVVPACGTCNSLLGDTLTRTITERRQVCHWRMRRKFRKVLRTYEYGADEMQTFGTRMRQYLNSEREKRDEVERMLAWPEDPNYDLRAFEKSGIDHPYDTGYLEPMTSEVIDRAARIARKPSKKARGVMPVGGSGA